MPSSPRSKNEPQVAQQLQSLKTATASSSATIDTMCDGLRRLGSLLYSGVEEMLLCAPSNRASLCRHQPLQRKAVEEELEQSLVLLDLCCATQESFIELTEDGRARTAPAPGCQTRRRRSCAAQGVLPDNEEGAPTVQEGLLQQEEYVWREGLQGGRAAGRSEIGRCLGASTHVVPPVQAARRDAQTTVACLQNVPEGTSSSVRRGAIAGIGVRYQRS